MSRRGLPPGVQRKHSRSCATVRDPDARCRCRGGYQVQAGSRGNRQTRTFPTLDAALAWKRDMDQARAAGQLAGHRAPTLRDAARRWEEDARAGVALARGGRRFRAGTLRDYRRSLDADLLDDYGAVALDDLGSRLGAVVAGLQRRGLAASSVRNAVMPLRAIYRHAVRMGWVAVNPTLGMEVPSGSGRRLRVLAASEVEHYLAVLDERDRPLWATAIHAGLRRGELMALRWADVDLAAGMICVDAQAGGYDPKARAVSAPKSEAGARRVPINGRLRELLVEHRARAGARRTGLVFARGSLAGTCYRDSADQPFLDTTVGRRAAKAWTDAGLMPVTLHDCRHTFASLMIAAMAQRGVFNPKLLQQVLGHSSIAQTYDRYGHLFPGQEAELGVMLDELLQSADKTGSAVTQGSSREQADSATIGNDAEVIDVAAARHRAARVQRTTDSREA